MTLGSAVVLDSCVCVRAGGVCHKTVRYGAAEGDLVLDQPRRWRMWRKSRLQLSDSSRRRRRSAERPAQSMRGENPKVKRLGFEAGEWKQNEKSLITLNWF
eukprot:1256613-Prymnesium_polylepis.1